MDDIDQEAMREELRDIGDFHFYALMTLMPDLVDADIDVPDFHWDIYKQLDKPQIGQTHGTLIVAPVGFSKSTIFKIWGVYQFLWGVDPYILYVSSTLDKAVDQFGGVKKIINDKHLQVVFEYTVTKQNTTEIVIQWRDGSESKFEAVASGQDISGINFNAQRPTLILIDDIEEIEQAKNIDRTNDLEEWVTTTLASRTPSIASGRIRMIGTVFSRDSLANRILGKSKTYDKKTFKNWLNVVYQALDLNHRSIWESRHPTYALASMRETDPKAFAANYMNDPLDEVIQGAYYEKEVARVMTEGRYGDHITYNPNKPVDTWWDVAVSSDLNAVWFTQQRDDGGVNFIDYWEGTGLSTRDISAVIYAKPYVYNAHYGPHDLHKTHAGEEVNRTLLNMYRSSGVNFTIVGKTSVESGRDAVRVLFPHFHFAATANVALGLNHLKSYRAQTIPNTGGLTREVHDIHSHCADALRVLAVKVSLGEQKPGAIRRTTIKKLLEFKHKKYENT